MHRARPTGCAVPRGARASRGSRSPRPPITQLPKGRMRSPRARGQVANLLADPLASAGLRRAGGIPPAGSRERGSGMSLVGSLEDLGLADILQIVSLSRKSGMLMLRSESGDGRIVLRNGLVQGAAIKGEPEDLRALLVSQGCVEAQAFNRARHRAGAESLALDEALERECGLGHDRLT